MGHQRDGISYQPEDQTERRSRVELAGITLEMVRVPPVAHAFHRTSPRHLLMYFTDRGGRSDGESRAGGRPVSRLLDTSRTFTLIPADCPYEGWTVPVIPAEYLSVAIDPATTVLDPAHGLAGLCRAAEVYRPHIPDELRTTLAKLRRLMATRDGLDTLHAETLLALLILETRAWVGSDRHPDAPHGGLARWQERRATAMLEARLDGQVGVVELASACGLSPSHFAQAFRRSTGMPPHRWLQHRRIDVAQDLLRRTTMPLADVALACGFANQSHFGRAFASMVGTSPGAWRRECGTDGGTSSPVQELSPQESRAPRLLNDETFARKQAKTAGT